jgi:hypothetical protein
MGRHRTQNDVPFRFILNHSKATAANVYLLLYPRAELSQALEQDPELARKIWHCLNALPPKTVLDQGRVYGGGLHKLEPRELGNVSADGIANLPGFSLKKVPQQLLLGNPHDQFSLCDS